MKTSAEFLGAGRSLPLWITGISFMAANLGSLEIVGHIGNGAKYGMMTNHLYWIGAIPADGVPGLVHGSLLLLQRRAQRPGIPQAPLR